jgi:hypothetical protein
MTRRPDYADSLRDAFLALALVPIAGLHTATYWFKESLERTSKLAGDVIATTALARSVHSATSGGAYTDEADATVDVLARDLVDSARTYLRSMIRLPADSALYFTGELERRLGALLQKIRPDASTDLEAFVADDLDRLLNELDRLCVVARAEAGREARERMPNKADRYHQLVQAIDRLRDTTQTERKQMNPGRTSPDLEMPSPSAPAGLDLERARLKLETALRELLELLAKGEAGKGLANDGILRP